MWHITLIDLQHWKAGGVGCSPHSLFFLPTPPKGEVTISICDELCQFGGTDAKKPEITLLTCFSTAVVRFFIYLGYCNFLTESWTSHKGILWFMLFKPVLVGKWEWGLALPILSSWCHWISILLETYSCHCIWSEFIIYSIFLDDVFSASLPTCLLIVSKLFTFKGVTDMLRL